MITAGPISAESAAKLMPGPVLLRHTLEHIRERNRSGLLVNLLILYILQIKTNIETDKIQHYIV